MEITKLKRDYNMNVRIPKKLKEKIREDAINNERTLSEQVRYILRKYYNL
ncbi:MAG TPA: ribbon-helix-helix protein, CopG family [Methanothermobacter sp.]|nr:ribbon-helix-helix protein, CopG family [Methanothermobacter sp.]